MHNIFLSAPSADHKTRQIIGVQKKSKGIRYEENKKMRGTVVTKVERLQMAVHKS